jgi:hypothetical protein
MACPWLHDLGEKKGKWKKLCDANKSTLENFHGMSMTAWSRKKNENEKKYMMMWHIIPCHINLGPHISMF